jgi:hypothetical protein
MVSQQANAANVLSSTPKGKRFLTHTTPLPTPKSWSKTRRAYPARAISNPYIKLHYNLTNTGIRSVHTLDDFHSIFYEHRISPEPDTQNGRYDKRRVMICVLLEARAHSIVDIANQGPVYPFIIGHLIFQEVAHVH